MSMAEDEERVGHIFPAETEVTADGEPSLLSPEGAARWKPLAAWDNGARQPVEVEDVVLDLAQMQVGRERTSS
jgi:hypothetical protein